MIRVIGAGLAGCEAAWQIAGAGVPVALWEQKPVSRSPAHRSNGFAELVCSNSFKAERLDSAAGLLKEELRRLGSLLLPCAQACRVPAGGALAVDRDAFSERVTARIRSHPLIRVVEGEAAGLPQEGIAVIATGPLTADALAKQVEDRCGGALRFYDAAAPVVSAESLGSGRIFAASRYGRGGDDAYLNCPMDKAEYETFYEALIHAECAPLHAFEAEDKKLYEGCMPVEALAKRGPDALRYGPLKPVGLRDPRTGRRPWAVVQLRREDAAGTLFNLVGFQTNLKFAEQKRVFGLIPGLEHAEYMRYGVMHRNTFLNSPRLLAPDYSLRDEPRLFFAGQLTGVEGYMESASSGILAGRNAVRRLRGEAPLCLPVTTMTGALAAYVSSSPAQPFEPMGANFGLLPPIEPKIRNKRERYTALSDRALRALEHALQGQNMEAME